MLQVNNAKNGICWKLRICTDKLTLSSPNWLSWLLERFLFPTRFLTFFGAFRTSSRRMKYLNGGAIILFSAAGIILSHISRPKLAGNDHAHSLTNSLSISAVHFSIAYLWTLLQVLLPCNCLHFATQPTPAAARLQFTRPCLRLLLKRSNEQMKRWRKIENEKKLLQNSPLGPAPPFWALDLHFFPLGIMYAHILLFWRWP